MTELWAALEATEIALYFRSSRWGYAGLNATHIAGLALLFGAVMALNLRLLGAVRELVRDRVVRLLSPLAAFGLAVALSTGFLLFSTRAGEYAQNEAFLVKVSLVLVGTLAALWAHGRHGLLLDRASRAVCRFHAILSMTCWTSALVAGRLIAFMD